MMLWLILIGILIVILLIIYLDERLVLYVNTLTEGNNKILEAILKNNTPQSTDDLARKEERRMTKTYRSKTHPNIICEAVQWFDTDESFEEMREFLGHLDGADLWSVDYRKRQASLSVTTDDYKSTAEEGDYVIHFCDRQYYAVKKDIFEEQWEYINETN